VANLWVSIAACGFGDELLNPEANPALLSEIISNALPQPMLKDGKLNELSVSCRRFIKPSHHQFENTSLNSPPSQFPPQNLQLNFPSYFQYFSKVLQNGSAESSESASTSSIGSNNSSHNRAPGSQLHHPKSVNNSMTLNSTMNGSTISSLQSTINNNSNNSNLLSNAFQEFSPEVSKQVS
jgi:hypothetical protein